MAVGFEKATGTKVAVVQKATGEMLAQIKAERANPKGDIWWAGAADNYLQAAEEGLLEEYRSPNVAQLYDWAQRITDLSKNRVAGVYGGILSLGYNTEIGAKKKLPVPKCWKDLLNPALKGEVMLGNPNSSGTAYLMLASLVQIMGEDEAFRYMADAEPQRDELRALRHRPDDRRDARRSLRRQHGAARRDQRDRARLSGAAGAAVRRRRLRGRLDGDHQGRAQPRRREEVLRLGADGGRARRSGSTSRSSRFRPTAACRCRRRCRSSPTSRSSTTTSRSTAPARRASACSSAGRRKSATRRDDRSPRPAAALARGRRRRVPRPSVVCAAGLRARHRVARATGPAATTRRRSCRSRVTGARGSRRSACCCSPSRRWRC